MESTITIPEPDVALQLLELRGSELASCLRSALEAQFECDDVLQQLINSKIGSPNELTGKAHSYTSAETWAKDEPMWRDARRNVISWEAATEDARWKLDRARLIARLAVLQVEKMVAA